MKKAKTKHRYLAQKILSGVVVLGVLVAGFIIYNAGAGPKATKTANSVIAALQKSDYQKFQKISGYPLSKQEFDLDALTYQHLVANVTTQPIIKIAGGRAVASYTARVDDGTASGVKINVLVFLDGGGSWSVVGIDAVDATNRAAPTSPAKYSDEKFKGWFYFVDFVALAKIQDGTTDTTAKDNVRERDLRLLHAQINAYHADTGNYPTLDDLNDPANSNIPGLAAVADPDGTAVYASNGFAAQPTPKAYSYIASSKLGTSCDNQTTLCQKFILSAYLNNGAVITQTGS